MPENYSTAYSEKKSRGEKKRGNKKMELLIPILVILIIDLLAIPFGADSRYGVDRPPESLGLPR
jgi:hypothetical protein